MSAKDPLAGLNPEQRAATLSRSHTIAIACPGSGKTKMLATKAETLLAEGARVAAATFTRDSAMELRERIIHSAGPGCQSRLLVGTFHSIDMLMAFPSRRTSEFGAMILRDMKSPFTKPWKIISEGNRRNNIFRAIEAAGLTGLALEDASRMIEVAKASKSSAGLEPAEAAMVRQYIDLLARSGEIDLQDIILLTNDALAAGTMSPLPVDYLLIDEFQDTDIAGFEWAAAHAKSGVSVTVVGDDDQSIYSFRRALGFEGLKKFETQFGAKRILLGTNYRCHEEILGSAAKLIQRNTERIEKRLFANKGPGGTVKWQVLDSTEAEAVEVGVKAKQALEEKKTFAVIARTNRRLDDVQSVMIRENIPYRRSDGSNVFNLPEVQVYGALLRTIVKPTANDVDKVLAWAGVSEEDLEAIHKKVGDNIYIGAAGDFANTNVSAKGLETWRSYAKKHLAWQNMNRTGGLSMLNLSVREWLEDFLRKPYTAGNLMKAHALYATRDATLEHWLKVIADAERMSKSKDKKDAGDKKDDAGVEKVTPVDLITAHGSKGLEYDGVCIIGLEEGVFPSKDSGLEEERRLMFVAMTRARQQLWMSASKGGKPSIFIEESGVLGTKVESGLRAMFA